MKKFFGFIIFVILSLCFVACELGLGEAVDTEAPSITIDFPKPDSIIRDAFRFTGDWSDDGTISEISISLDRTDGIKTDYGPFKANFEKSTNENEPNKWYFILDPLNQNEKILDGSYVATVSITDEAGHKTIQTRQFTIDNTAPIVVLQRPSAKLSESSFDSYGQTFSLEGQAADDNNVSTITVNIYSDPECQNFIHSVDLTNVPPTISLDVAKFIEGTENDYSKIYGSTSKNGTKQLFCKITAYDGAQRFPTDGSNQTPEDLRGNATNDYYLYEDIATSVLSDFKITEIYHIFNGNYYLSKSNRSIEGANNITEILSNAKIDAGKFSLNPANNPTFSVSGRNPLSVEDNKYSFTNDDNVSNGGNVVIEVATGLDAIPLNAESLKVYAQLYDSSTGELTGERIYPETGEPTKSGTSYKFVVPLNSSKGFVIGKNYLLGVEGFDKATPPNPVVPMDGAYGFHFASSGAAPNLSVSSPAKTITYLSKGKNLVFAGEVSSEEAGAKIALIKDEVEIFSKIIDDVRGVFEFTVPAGEGGFNQNTSEQYSYSLVASQYDLSSTVNRTVLYDVEGPEINIDSMLPTAAKYVFDENNDLADESGVPVAGEYLNGDVTLKLSIVDDYDTVDTSVNKPYFELVGSDGEPISFRVNKETSPSEKHYITTPTKQNFVIHTEEIPDQTVELRIYAWDRAGNQYKNNYLSTSYVIDQSTDIPVILPNNSSLVTLNCPSKDKRDELGKNSFASGSQLLLKLIDDDGIKSVSVYCGDVGLSDEQLVNEAYRLGSPDEYQSYSTEMVYTKVLPAEAGYYKIKVVVTDKNEKVSIQNGFVVRVTAAAPVLKSVTRKVQYVSTLENAVNNQFENEIIVKGSEKPFYLFRKADSDFVNGDIPVIKPAVSEEVKFAEGTVLGSGVTYVGKFESETYTDIISNTIQTDTVSWYYKVYDENWNPTVSSEPIECIVDGNRPSGVASISKPENSSVTVNEKAFYAKDQVTLKVITSDGAPSCGIKKVSYNTVTDAVSDTNWKEMDRRDGYYDVSLSGLSEGEHNVYFLVEDNAGNKSADNKANIYSKFYVDTTAPETISLKKAICAGNEYTNFDNTILVNGKNDVKLEFTAEDKNQSDSKLSSGIDSILAKKVGTQNAEKSAAAVYDSTTKLWTLNIDKDDLTSGNIVLKLSDKAGNSSEFTTDVQLSMDRINPKIESINPSLSTGKDENGNNIVNGKIKLSGKAIDSNLNSVDVCYWNDSAWVNIYHGTGGDISDWTTGEIDTTLLTDNSTYTYAVIAIDKAGNCNLDIEVKEGKYYPKAASAEELKTAAPEACKSLKVEQDTDRPVIKFSTLNLAGDSTGIVWLKNQTKLVGSISDDDGIESFKIALSNSTNEADWKSITVDGGSWNFDLAEFYSGNSDEKEESANGIKSLYFKVKDTAGQEFISKSADSVCREATFNTIKIADSSTTLGLLKDDKKKISTSTVLNLTVDTLAPKVEISGGKLTGETNYSNSISNIKLGGTNKSFEIKAKVQDSVGIKSISDEGVIGVAIFKNNGNTVISKTGTVTSDSEANSYIISFNLTDAEHNSLIAAKYDNVVEIKVTGVDTAGNKASQSSSITADFKKPEIKLSAPKATEYVSGSVTTYGTIDSAKAMYYAVTKIDATEPVYNDIVGSSLQWFVYFDDGLTTGSATHDKTFKKYLIDLGITTEEAISNKTYTKITPLKLWVKAVDEAGNETVEKYTIQVDPIGDAPKVTIDYPEENGTTLGGTVTLRGTATDTIGTNIGVDSVWVQLITNYDPSKTFAPTMKDVKLWFERKNNTSNAEVYTNIQNSTPTSVAYNTIKDADDTADGSAYYVKANFAGSAWSLKININGAYDPSSGNTNMVGYRIFAKDKDNTLSREQKQYSVFDSDNPVLSNLYLRQYENNEAGTGKIVASREYSDDMWVKGVWWLCGDVTDTQGISELNIAETPQPLTNDGNGLQTFKYKLATGAEGEAGNVNITIEAKDKVDTGAKPHSTTRTCNIKYDNKEPELITSGSKFNINNTLRNSNGFYTFGSQVTEDPVNGKEQSGYSYLAFWIERNITGKHVVYDVMRSKELSEVNYSGLTLDSGLMWKQKTVTRNSNALGTLTLSALDENIHVGGLCKIGGSIYLINSVSSNGLTIGIKGQPEMPELGNTETALFAVANVVDNTIEAGSGSKVYTDGKYGYLSSISNDDGDNMIESVQKSGTTWTWEANINSQNIPDGSVTLHYVVFDGAGNYKEGAVTANVANNAPRLASLEVWSDFNEDGTKQSGEYDTFYNSDKEVKLDGKWTHRAGSLTSELIVSGNKKDFDGAGSSFMTVKADVRFTPEIIGGNGDLYYTYRYKKNNSTAWTNAAIGSSSIGTGIYDGVDEEIDEAGYNRQAQAGGGYISGRKDIYLSIPGAGANSTDYALNNIGNSTSDADPTWFEYTIYDSTEGCDTTWNTSTLSVNNRLSAKFRVALNNQYNDTVAPEAFIKPFYWEGKDKNSVSWNDDEPEGHIELEADLSTEIMNTYGDTSSAKDPKVSGKIKVEGYAFDDIKLAELYIKFEGHTSLKTAQLASSYHSGIWQTKTYSESDGWGFSAEDEYCNANGHRVKWTLIVDTAKRSTVSDVDKAFVIYAVDSRGNTESAHNGTVQTVKDALTYYYKVDIVPYITEIQTSAGNLYSSKSSVYGRTSTGKYPVYESEEITIKGFNLGSGSDTEIKIGEAALTATTVSSKEITTSIPVDTASGQLSLAVGANKYPAVNNLNNDDAKGDYQGSFYDAQGRFTATYSVASNGYNRRPNNINNNRLTDDVNIDVWKFKTAATPRDGEILYPEMEIGPNGEVGFAFVNGNFYFNMAGGTKAGDATKAGTAKIGEVYSETTANTWASQRGYESDYAPYYESALAFDKNGVTYGISTNQDSNKYYSAYTSFYYGQRASNNPYGASYSGLGNGNYQGGAYRRRLQSTTSTVVNNIQDTSVYRAMSPTLATVTNTDSTNVYMAFYDAVRKEIRYRWGTIGDSVEKAAAFTSNYEVKKLEKVDAEGTGWRYGHFKNGEEYLFSKDEETITNYSGIGDEETSHDKGYGGGESVYFYNMDGSLYKDNDHQYEFYTGINFNQPGTWFRIHKTKDEEDISHEKKAITPFPGFDTKNKRISSNKYISKTYYENGLRLDNIKSTNHGLSVGDRVSLSFENNTYVDTYMNELFSKIYYVKEIIDADNFTVSEVQGGDVKYFTYNCVLKAFSKIEGQLTDATGGRSTKNDIIPTAADRNEDKSVLPSQYSVVASNVLTTKNTAAVAIGAVPANGAGNDVVVMAWFDGANLKYAYETNPQRDDNDGSGALFTNVSTLDTSSGQFVRLKVDKIGGIHIAYYDNSNADLKYAYASGYNQPFTKVVIDSYQIVGSQIDLDVAKDGENWVPYISYYNASSQAAKIAYPVKWSNNKPTLEGVETVNGKSNDLYSQNWEISVIPKLNKSPKEDTICVGVHKDWSTGDLGSIISTASLQTLSSETSVDANPASRTGGNGTSNPALAFTIQEDDSLQFVQKN